MLISLQIQSAYLVCEVPYMVVALTSVILITHNLKKIYSLLKGE